MQALRYASEIDPIRRLVLKHPRDAFISQDTIDKQWQELNYADAPDYSKALDEYEAFCSILQKEIPDIVFLPSDEHTGLDSIYVRDASIGTSEGVILCNMGKELRRGEPSAQEKYYRENDIPILGAVHPPGFVEGGDVVLLDKKTLIVGHGYRTNAEGVRQLNALTKDLIEEFVIVPLPHWNGADDVMHLMSFLSPVDHDLAVVYSRIMPVPFRRWLQERGMQFVEVPDEEFPKIGCNVLALAPGKALMLQGNPETRKQLESRGVEVIEYTGEEISRKGAGGPTCLTRPIIRS